MEQMHLPFGAGLPYPGVPHTHRPVAKHRLFLGVIPNDEAQLRIGGEAWRLHNQLGLRGRPLEIGRFHLTLFSLGDHPALPERTIAAARRAADTVAARSFDICLDRAKTLARREGPQPLVMLGEDGTHGFERLRDQLAAALRHAGLEVHPGTPQMTLLHDRRQIDEMPVKPVRFRVKEFVLVDSDLGHSRHATLDRWALLG